MKKLSAQLVSYSNLFKYLTVFALIASTNLGISQIRKDFLQDSHSKGSKTHSKSNKKDSTNTKQDSVYLAVELKAIKFNLLNIFDTIQYDDTLLRIDFPYNNNLDKYDFPIIDNGYIGSSAMP